MGSLKYFISVILFFTITSVVAQYHTGSDDLNKSLVRIDADASVNFGGFRADISGSYDISENKIDYLAVKVGMTAGDIYMALEIGKITHKSIDHVVEVYQANKGKGWGVIAKELGIKPGSPEFHALKGKGSKKGNGHSNNNKAKGKKG
jgi:hypothetical protein